MAKVSHVMQMASAIWAFAEASIAGPVNWRRVSRAAPSQSVRPIFMLKHNAQAVAALEESFWEVSTPGRPGYGEHLSRSEVDAKVPPVAGAREAVLAFLKEQGLQPTSEASDMIEAEMQVSVAERLFQMELHQFEHKDSGVRLVRGSGSYSVPAELAQYLYLIGDLTGLPAINSPKLVKSYAASEQPEGWPQDCSGCSQLTTPAVLREAYKIGEATEVKTSMAVAEFQGQSYDEADLKFFQQDCELSTPVKVDRRVGPNEPSACQGSQACIEALLDIEYIKAVGGDIPLTDISLEEYSLLKFAKEVATMENAPQVLSVSYGNDEVQQTSREFMDAVNVQFMKLGARGISVLFAAGDQGVYGRSGPTPDGRFHPDFPAASPYVTAVGGTDFAQKSVIGAEKAWQSGGGGFSDTFPMPAYQKDFVERYLSEAKAQGVLPSTSNFNSSGRGYPDVAALGGMGNAYCISASLYAETDSTMLGVAGTSASCPVVAAVFARLNGLRAAKGLPAMGFLNPFIYMHGEAFNDVALGVNSDTGPEGFHALAGWDPATGMGTPDFSKLEVAAMKAVAKREATLVV